MLFLLASFTITLSHQLFCTCSITCCLLFCANVYISPCYFTLCNFILVSIVAHLCFTLTPLHFACYSYLSICYLTLQVVTLPFDLLFLACVSLCVVYASFHFVSPNTSPYYFLRHFVTSHFFKYFLLLPPLVKLLVILCFVSFFSHMLFNEILKVHRAQILSCSSLGVGA